MNEEYRGYEIGVYRSEEMIHYKVTRISDGEVFIDVSSWCGDTAEDMMGYMKERIDMEHKDDDPWMEIADRGKPRFKY